MTAKAKVYWSAWIGVWTGLYVLLYLLSPLSDYGIIWVTFIALPIFFNGGALRKDYVPQMLCSCIGVIWGVIIFAGVGFLMGTGLNAEVANGISCGLFTITCCMMMIFNDKTMLNKVPAMFGGISACFSQGAATDKLIPVMITLCLGVTLGLLCNEGGPICERLAGSKKDE